MNPLPRTGVGRHAELGIADRPLGDDLDDGRLDLIETDLRAGRVRGGIGGCLGVGRRLGLLRRLGLVRSVGRLRHVVVAAATGPRHEACHGEQTNQSQLGRRGQRPAHHAASVSTGGQTRATFPETLRG